MACKQNLSIVPLERERKKNISLNTGMISNNEILIAIYSFITTYYSTTTYFFSATSSIFISIFHHTWEKKYTYTHTTNPPTTLLTLLHLQLGPLTNTHPLQLSPQHTPHFARDPSPLIVIQVVALAAAKHGPAFILDLGHAGGARDDVEVHVGYDLGGSCACIIAEC